MAERCSLLNTGRSSTLTKRAEEGFFPLLSRSTSNNSSWFKAEDALNWNQHQNPRIPAAGMEGAQAPEWDGGQRDRNQCCFQKSQLKGWWAAQREEWAVSPQGCTCSQLCPGLCQQHQGGDSSPLPQGCTWSLLQPWPLLHQKKRPWVIEASKAEATRVTAELGKCHLSSSWSNWVCWPQRRESETEIAASLLQPNEMVPKKMESDSPWNCPVMTQGLWAQATTWETCLGTWKSFVSVRVESTGAGGAEVLCRVCPWGQWNPTGPGSEEPALTRWAPRRRGDCSTSGGPFQPLHFCDFLILQSIFFQSLEQVQNIFTLLICISVRTSRFFYSDFCLWRDLEILKSTPTEID